MLFNFSLLKIDTGDENDESERHDSESNEGFHLSKITEMRLMPSAPTQCTLRIPFIFHIPEWFAKLLMFLVDSGYSFSDIM